MVLLHALVAAVTIPNSVNNIPKTMKHTPSVSFFILIALSVTLFSHVTEAQDVRPFYCAKCIRRSSRCGSLLASRCGACTEGIDRSSQPVECEMAACSFCRRPGKATMSICRSRALRELCDLSSPEAPTLPPTTSSTTTTSATTTTFSTNTTATTPTVADPTTTVTPKITSTVPTRGDPSPNTCIWRTQDGRFSIPLGEQRNLADGWTGVKRGDSTGIVYEKERKSGIDPKGKYGVMCFKVQVQEAGNYYLSAVSYSPHNTEHNDVWVRSGKGFDLWQRGNKWRYANSDEWLKAYQNNAGWSEDFKTKDHDGHRFVIPSVATNEVFQVCLSGRSSKFEMFALVLAKCNGGTCQGDLMKGITAFPASKCT